VKGVVETAKSNYGDDMKASDKRQIERRLNTDADRIIDKLHGNYQIEQNVLETQRVAEMQNRYETGKTSEEIDEEFRQKKQEAAEKFQEELKDAIQEFVDTSA